MPTFQPGLVHTPLTPFTHEHRIDLAWLGKIIDFHIANAADSLALPMHVGESVSLSDGEKREVIAFAIKQAEGRLPVIAHVSDAGSEIAAALARHAQEAGAAAIVTTTPYYWTPPPAMLREHFFRIGAAAPRLPFFIYYTPEEMPGTKITAELCLKLIEQLPNFAGVVDLSLDWQFTIELMTYAPRARRDFQLLSGTEHMVSARAIGATGLFSPLAGVAPKLVRRLYDLCRKDALFEAREAQEEVAALRHSIKPGGVASLKAAMREMGRDCGLPRPPLQPLDETGIEKLAAALRTMTAIRAERRGW